MESGSSKFLHSRGNPPGSTPPENEGEGERLGLAASQEERLYSSVTPRPKIVSCTGCCRSKLDFRFREGENG
jgi:hypothetical protein